MEMKSGSGFIWRTGIENTSIDPPHVRMHVKKVIFRLLRYSGLPWLCRELLQRHRVTILMFHEIDRGVATRTFAYLRRKYAIIPLRKLREAIDRQDPTLLPRKAMVITFDDGHRSNFRLREVLRDLEVPTTIFLCAGIVGTNRHYWFKSVPAQVSKEKLKKMPNRLRLAALAKLGFQNEQEFDEPQSLSGEQIEDMRSWVDFQGHTQFHPCLPTCTDLEAKSEIETSKKILESAYGLRIDALAYPNGEYSHRDIELMKACGYKLGLSLDSGYNTVKTDPFRLKRLSVNDTKNMDELIVKASGLWGLLKPKHGLRNPIEMNSV